MRTIKELLQLMLDNQHLFDEELCIWAYYLYHYSYISTKEHRALKQYIHQNTPVHVDTDYWWEAGDITPRIEWIKEQIKKLENEK